MVLMILRVLRLGLPANFAEPSRNRKCQIDFGLHGQLAWILSEAGPNVWEIPATSGPPLVRRSDLTFFLLRYTHHV